MGIKIVYILFFLNLFASNIYAIPHYYCTPSDERHFPLLMNLIGSIHKNDYEDLSEIAVFDLGMIQEQLNILKNVKKVKLYKFEMTHPDLLKYFKTCSSGRMVRGWFAWQPVMIKQALDKFPYVLSLDAGTTVLQPLENLFCYIKEKGYFFIEAKNTLINKRASRFVVNNLIENNKLLLTEKACTNCAGTQGVSRKVYNEYVKPVYSLSYDLRYFIDDDSSEMGFGSGRHSQTLFGIYIQKNNMYMHPMGWLSLLGDNKIHVHWDRSNIKNHTSIYQSRWDTSFIGGHSQYVKYSNKVNFDMKYWLHHSCTSSWKYFMRNN